MKFVISNEAGKDIEEIWLYTFKNWSIEQADKYLNMIMNEIEYITQHPKSGKNYGNIKKGYFRFRVKSHFIFYKINSKKEVIKIIRVLHQKMDIDNRLNY